MSPLSFIRFKAAFVAAAFILATPIVGLAGEKIKDLSPDGQFAMSLEDGGDGEVQISLVEAKSHKFLLKLDDSGHPYCDVARILWTPDSKRFAFQYQNRRGDHTSIYICKDGDFEEVELPDFPECDHPGLDGFIIEEQTAKSWIKPDTLVLLAHSEWSSTDGKSHECDRTVTIIINSTGKARIQSVHEMKKE
jgi:hypothetical protein